MGPISTDSITATRQPDWPPLAGQRRAAGDADARAREARVPGEVPAEPHAASEQKQLAPDDRSHPDNGPITGKVFALKDGSGYAVLGSDGHYYRLPASGQSGAAAGFVDAAFVNVAGGPVSAVGPPSGVHEPDAHRTRGDAAHDPHDAGQATLPGQKGAAQASAPRPALHDAEHANAVSREAKAAIIGQPEAAVRSQANASAPEVLALLR